MALASLCALALMACSQQTAATLAQEKKTTEARKEVGNFEFVLLSYLDRPIFDAFANGQWVGGAGPFGSKGTVTGVLVRFGVQEITWRDAGTGETTKAANQPVLSRPDQKKVNYLGMHIYPDSTVELIPSEHFPKASLKGEALYEEWKKTHGE